MKPLYKKEMAHYLNNPTGIIIIVLFGLLANFLFVKDIFAQQSASMRPFFIFTAWLLTIFVPALCMRSFAAEKQGNTIETLLTMPMTEKNIVLAKFFSVLTIVGFSLLLTVGLPLSLSSVAGLYIPEILMGYIGLLFVAALFISISFAVSLKTNSQIVSFFVSAVLLFLFASFSSDFVASFVPRFISDTLSLLAPFALLDTFVKGVFDIRALIYFISVTGFFLLFTTKELTKRQ